MRMFFLLVACAGLSSCTSLVLKPVEYTWPVERVLEVDGQGQIHDDRYMLTMNVKPLFYEEMQDSVNVFGAGPAFKVGRAAEQNRCISCQGRIKQGFDILNCRCGGQLHLSCAKRVGECPVCGQKYSF